MSGDYLNEPSPVLLPERRSDEAQLAKLEAFIRFVVRDEMLQQPSSSEAAHGELAIRNGAPSDDEVMTADDVAAFLGVDRNTVYDYAGRGTIPCRRLGKRLLFHRPALVSWLDPCKAVGTRRG